MRPAKAVHCFLSRGHSINCTRFFISSGAAVLVKIMFFAKHKRCKKALRGGVFLLCRVPDKTLKFTKMPLVLFLCACLWHLAQTKKYGTI